MKKRIILALVAALTIALLSGCGAKNEASPAPAAEAPAEEEAPSECPLEDGEYEAVFTTDSSMFHVNEANEDKGVLTVKDGKMTIHVTLAGKGILKLYAGLATDAETDSANVIDHTEDEVNYSDGTTETAYGFDIPVPYLDEEFDCAIIGKKDKWYDHKVSVKVAE